MREMQLSDAHVRAQPDAIQRCLAAVLPTLDEATADDVAGKVLLAIEARTTHGIGVVATLVSGPAFLADARIMDPAMAVDIEAALALSAEKRGSVAVVAMDMAHNYFTCCARTIDIEEN